MGVLIKRALLLDNCAGLLIVGDYLVTLSAFGLGLAQMMSRSRAARELGVRHAGFAVRDAKQVFEMQSFCISGSET